MIEGFFIFLPVDVSLKKNRVCIKMLHAVSVVANKLKQVELEMLITVSFILLSLLDGKVVIEKNG